MPKRGENSRLKMDEEEILYRWRCWVVGLQRTQKMLGQSELWAISCLIIQLWPAICYTNLRSGFMTCPFSYLFIYFLWNFPIYLRMTIRIYKNKIIWSSVLTWLTCIACAKSQLHINASSIQQIKPTNVAKLQYHCSLILKNNTCNTI